MITFVDLVMVQKGDSVALLKNIFGNMDMIHILLC
jgi:hypothetical protein